MAKLSSVQALWIRRAVLAALPAAMASLAQASEVTGHWDGALEVGSSRLTLALHVIQDNGVTRVMLDSPDQATLAVPSRAAVVSGSELYADWFFGAFAASASADGRLLTGRWTQNGAAIPLSFVRRGMGPIPVNAPAVTPAVIKRVSATPQPPPAEVAEVPAAKPGSFAEVEARFANPAASGVELAGTLSLPKGRGPFPAVVLIAGSGPMTRNEDVAGHALFKGLADHLNQNGLAVLRFDKRGVGKSTGDYGSATSLDFASDVHAALHWLRNRPETDVTRVGLIGHSEGGMIAPMVAVKDQGLAFVVLMAGTAVPGAEVLELQNRRLALANGASEDQVEGGARLNRALYGAVTAATSGDDAYAKAHAIFLATAPAASPAVADSQSKALSSPWLRYMLAYDPTQTLTRLRGPVLAMNGSKDLQVPADQNLPAMRRALGANPQATIVELPGLNHLFQTAVTGSPKEYETLKEGISPAALKTITDWIRPHLTY